MLKKKLSHLQVDTTFYWLLRSIHTLKSDFAERVIASVASISSPKDPNLAGKQQQIESAKLQIQFRLIRKDVKTYSSFDLCTLLSNRENVVACTFLIIPIVHCGKVRISKFDELHQIHPCEAEAPICPCLFISPPMSLMNDGTSNPSLTIPEDVICPQCGIVQHRVNPLAWNSTVGLCTVCVKNGADHLPHDRALLTVRIPAAGKLCTLCERWFPAQHCIVVHFSLAFII